nr:MAG TPA: hypothetical protein [Myoviridae sp. ctLGX4]
MLKNDGLEKSVKGKYGVLSYQQNERRKTRAKT